MRRFGISDHSPDALLYPTLERCRESEFQAMLSGLEEEDSTEESSGKKRRLGIEQVRALERIFEVDNKLDPERKLRLAQELGLQPRQVAIWFQNRRARWKTKQMERDYNLLKANYEALQLDFNKIEQEKQLLTAELRGLKEKLGEENAESDHSASRTAMLESPQTVIPGKSNSRHEEVARGDNETSKKIIHGVLKQETMEFKEGCSDSDSSGDQRPTSEDHNHSAFSMNSSDYHFTRTYQQQTKKTEDQHGMFNVSGEPCNIFSVDQAPNLYWYFPDQRS